MAEGALQATRAAPKTARQAPAVRQAPAYTAVRPHMLFQPGEGAARSADARAARAASGAFPTQNRSPRQRHMADHVAELQPATIDVGERTERPAGVPQAPTDPAVPRHEATTPAAAPWLHDPQFLLEPDVEQVHRRTTVVDRRWDDVSAAGVNPQQDRSVTQPAALWSARIQRCGIGSSCGCELHDKLAGVRGDLQRTISDGGAALPGATQAQMEEAFSADFSAVRVHTGPAAQEFASILRAHALTTGSDIVFEAGAYRPGTPSGDRLLAHELAHVVQQRHGLPRAPLDGGAADPLERAADQAAEEARLSAESESHGAAIAPGQGGRVPWLSHRFPPEMQDGQSLPAHELTQVGQRSGIGQADAGRNDEAGSPSPVLGRSSEKLIQRKGFESTVQVCHRVLKSRNFEVSKGGLRVVLILDKLDKAVLDCRDFDFGVTLTRSKDWWFDDEIGTCEAPTGGTRSFSFANLTSGTYYLTIWRNFDHPYCCLSGDLLVFDEPVANDSNGCSRHKDLSVMEIVHGALDIAGFIPVLGAIPDGINAGIYALEGNWANAGLSAVAMIPLWGDGVKLGTIAEKSAIKISEKAAIRLGEEGIAKGLKEVKAASNVEKAALQTTEEAAKVEKATVGAVEETTEEAAEKSVKESAEHATKEAAEKELKERIAECEAIWASYKALGSCRACNRADSPAERAAKIACITAVLVGRRRYLAEKCDYVLPGSIARGSTVAERGHKTQVVQIEQMLAKCASLPTT